METGNVSKIAMKGVHREGKEGQGLQAPGWFSCPWLLLTGVAVGLSLLCCP